jgi:E3 ubiquitin ligase
MNTVFAIIAAIAAVIGAGLLWWRRSVGGEIAIMASTLTSAAGEVAKLAPGTLTEVKGTLRVREPLTAEFSRQPCAYFKSEIERKETYWERDSQGRDQRRTRTSTVYTNMKYGSCLIQDDNGRVGIDFDGANVEAVEVVNEPTAAPNSGSGIVAGVLSALSNANSTYRRKESILAPDIPVYVLGEVQPGGLIGKPGTGSKNKIFVVSHKSEEERTKSLTATTRWLFAFAILCFAIAAGMLVWSISEGQKPKAAGLILPAAVFAQTSS